MSLRPGSLKFLLDWLLPTTDRRVARQTLWMGAITAVQILSGLGQVAFSARILGPESFGVLSIFIAVTLFLYGFMSLQGHEAITTYVTRSMAEGRPEEAAGTLRFTLAAALGMGLFSYGLLAVFTLAFSGVVGIEEPHWPAMLAYGLTGIFMAAHMESLAALRLADRLSLGFAVAVAGALTRLVALAALWLSGSGQLLMVTWAFVAGAFVAGAGMFLAVAASAGRSDLPEFLRSLSLRVPADVFRFQWMSFLQTKVGALGWQADVLMMATMTGPAQVGLYRAAGQIADATRLPVVPIGQGVQVEYSRRWYARDGAGLRRVSRRFTLLSVGLATLVYGLLILFHQPVIRIMLGPEFAGAASPLLILIPGAFAFMCVAALHVLPAATGRVMPSLIWNSTSLAALAVAMFLLVPAHGAEGAAWARTIFLLVLVAVVVPFAASVLRKNYRREE